MSLFRILLCLAALLPACVPVRGEERPALPAPTRADVAYGPHARNVLDFWQADGQGAYDNAGYRLRGHQSVDGEGRYRLETVLPGLYPGRTRHIHVKVAVPNKPTLTTQLYVPGEARNSNDSIFDQALVVSIRDTPDGSLATFDFVLDVS